MRQSASILVWGRTDGKAPHLLEVLTLRVQVPNNLVLGLWVIVIIIQVLGKYMIIGYMDP